MVFTILYRSSPNLPKLFFIYFSKPSHRVTEQIFKFVSGPTQKYLMVFIENSQYFHPVRAHFRIYFFEYVQVATCQLPLLAIPMARMFYFFLTYCFLICLIAFFVFSGFAYAKIFSLLIIDCIFWYFLWNTLNSLTNLWDLLLFLLCTNNFLKLLYWFH